jgi:hypothetical protein
MESLDALDRSRPADIPREYFASDWSLPSGATYYATPSEDKEHWP